jgi:hypothetical protein
MKVLYKPLGMIAKLVGRRAGRTAFRGVWERVGDTDYPPAPNAGYRPLSSVFFTAALEAAVLAGVGAVCDQLAGRVFHQLVGAWPNEPLPHPDGEPDLAKAPAAGLKS